MEGLQAVEHLNEVGPAGLLGDFGRLFGLGYLLQQVAIVRILHNDTKSGSPVFHEALFV